MGKTEYQVGINITARNNSDPALRGVMSSVDKATASLGRLQQRMQSIGRDAQQVGFTLSAGLTAPIAAATKGVVDTMRGYEVASAKLAATMGRDVDQIAKLQQQAEKLAGKTIFSETQILGAQRETAMAGFSQPEILTATPQILNLATMADMEIPKAAQMATDVLRGLDMPVEKLDRLLDVVAFASTKANQDTEQFLRGLTRFGPIARAVRLPLEDSTAMLSTLADAGFKAAEGGNALRTIMLRLSAPTKGAREALAGLNLDIANFTTGKTADAAGVVNALVQAGTATAADLERIKDRIEQALEIEPPEGMTRQMVLSDLIATELKLDGADGAAMTEALGDYLSRSVAGLDHQALLKAVADRLEATGVDPLPVINALFGKMRAAQGAALLDSVDDIAKRTAQIADKAAGSAGRMAKTMTETIDAQIGLVTSAKEVFQRKIWDAGFGDTFELITQKITNLLLGLAELPPNVLNTATKFASLAAVVGPATLAVGAFIRIAGFALAPLAALGAAIVALTTRTVMFAASLVSLKALRFLASPLGMASVAFGGLAASMLGAVKVSPVVGKSLSALGKNASQMWQAVSAGDGDALRQAVQNAGRNLRILRFEIRQGIEEWMNGTAAGRRFADIWQSVTRIATNTKNAVKNVAGALAGFVTGVADGLGVTGSLGDNLKTISDKAQAVTAWFLRMFAALTRTDDNSKSLSETFAALGETIGKIIRLFLDPLQAALKTIQQAFEDLTSSGAWKAFEQFLGLEAGATVEGLNQITNAMQDLVRATLALGMASVALFGFKKTIRGVRGALGMAAAAGAATTKGGKAAGTAAGIAGAGKAGSNSVLSKIAKWMPAVAAIGGGLTILGAEQHDAARRIELAAEGLTPEQATGQAMRERHERFRESGTGRFLDWFGKPFEQISEKINGAMGFEPGEGLADLITGQVTRPTLPVTPDVLQAQMDAHQITNIPQVRESLLRAGQDAGARAGAGLFGGLKEAARQALQLKKTPDIISAPDLEMRAPKLEALQVDTPKLEALRVVVPDLTAPEIPRIGLDAPQIDPLAVKPPVLDALRVDMLANPVLDVKAPVVDVQAPAIRIPDLVAPEFSPMQMLAPEIAPPAIPPVSLAAPKLEAPAPIIVDIPKLQAPEIKAPSLDAPRFDPVKVVAPEIRTPEPLRVDAPKLQAPEIKAPAIPPVAVAQPDPLPWVMQQQEKQEGRDALSAVLRALGGIMPWKATDPIAGADKQQEAASSSMNPLAQISSMMKRVLDQLVKALAVAGGLASPALAQDLAQPTFPPVSFDPPAFEVPASGIGSNPPVVMPQPVMPAPAPVVMPDVVMPPMPAMVEPVTPAAALLQVAPPTFAQQIIERTQEAPPPFDETGVQLVANMSKMAQELAEVKALLASGGVKADVETKGKVDINIKTAPGVRATGISTSSGDVDLSLNVGTDSLSAG